MDSAGTIDLVCWDFGDTLVDETFMQYPPDGVPEWPAAYREMFAEDPSVVDRLDRGSAALHEFIAPMAERVPMSRAAIARHLRSVFHRIEWLPGMRELLTELDGRVLQAIVTVNPHEFAAMAVACGLEPLVDVIVTSADVGSLSKPVMTERARSLLGLAPGLGTSLLVDNKQHNVDDFLAAGGRAIRYTPGGFADAWSTATRGTAVQPGD
ncbi:MAG: hypothetical protein AAF567_04075 [Actinomycetota bacterium]